MHCPAAGAHLSPRHSGLDNLQRARPSSLASAAAASPGPSPATAPARPEKAASTAADAKSLEAALEELRLARTSTAERRQSGSTATTSRQQTWGPNLAARLQVSRQCVQRKPWKQISLHASPVACVVGSSLAQLQAAQAASLAGCSLGQQCSHAICLQPFACRHDPTVNHAQQLTIPKLRMSQSKEACTGKRCHLSLFVAECITMVFATSCCQCTLS